MDYRFIYIQFENGKYSPAQPIQLLHFQNSATRKCLPVESNPCDTVRLTKYPITIYRLIAATQKKFMTIDTLVAFLGTSFLISAILHLPATFIPLLEIEENICESTNNMCNGCQLVKKIGQ